MEFIFSAFSLPSLPLKILVVDAESGIRQILRKALEIDGHQIYEATDGVLAMSLFEAIRPDLVLLDIILPKQDGLCVLQKIRTLDNIAGIIIISTLSSKSLMVRSTLINADAYLQKPFRVKILQMHVRFVMSKVLLRQPCPSIRTLYNNGFHHHQ